MMKCAVIDCEVRVVHKAGRNPNYLKNSNEGPIRDIYQDRSIKKAIKLWNVESLIKSMNKNKIRYAVISGLAWVNRGALKANNEYVKYCLDKYENRLLGFYNVPTHNIKKAVSDIINLDKKKYLGVEIIPKWQNININDKKLTPIINIIKKRKMFLKIYTAHPTQTLNGDSPFRTLSFLKKNKNLKVIIPHLGGLLTIYALMPKIKKIIKNVYFITSVSKTMDMVKFSSEINSKNLLFGTDYPFNHCFNQSFPIKKINELKISIDTRKKIFSENALKIFNFKK